MYATVIKTGSYAHQRYHEVERVLFHTELAALLYGYYRCPQYGLSHYWIVECPQSNI